MSANSEAVKAWRKRTKERMIEAMGGKCAICSYDRCTDALEFHHLDPTKKDFSFGAARANPKSWVSLVEELRKCVMLCANCHREVHDGMHDGKMLSASFDENYADYGNRYMRMSTTFCPVCNGPKSDTAKTCSLSCSGKMKITVDWDSIDLMAEITKRTMSDIAEQMGCTVAAVTKRKNKLIEMLNDPK